MAAKDAVAIILDVSLSMTQAPPGHETPLETSTKAINMIIQRKMFANAKDEFCLILFGTDVFNYACWTEVLQNVNR
ncbi:X-ray repair cross-complementing protein 5 [Exaiptasia diaphana]|nr:X-ray repair cross-complementing protein 5 [Exaiptasia diaphana]